MKILALDTSGPVASVALAEDGKLIGGFRLQYKTTHSQNLMPMMEELKTLSHLDLDTIDAVALSSGPGSFTGLRIGAASAKGLCLALQKPLIPVPTLHALAYQMCSPNTLVCPMMDARRGQVYTGLFAFDSSLLMTPLVDSRPCSVEEICEACNRFAKEKQQTVALLGDGIPVYLQRIGDLLHIPYFIAPLHRDRQSAEAVCSYVFDLLRKDALSHIAIPADDFVPAYYRPSQAERTATVVRRMEESDLDACAALEKENFSTPWTLTMLKEAATASDKIFLIAERGNQIIGMCGLQLIAGEGEISNVSVSKEHRREGIATRMLMELLKIGRKADLHAFTLEVRRSNLAARRLYEKFGFVSEGIRPGFYDQPKEDAEILWLREEKDIS
ncbi:MAG: tRNA (adenosine(37)-N6)-threonylcarbamoyltransferase complex dimerization subunit type 1 TsaB [Lachnospiraceae bacterium]|nr:tRNA (adenosine(37)-N6)-threonylcarbamoyltransferase complex dimerization subunit type 1 TsaB [Lachnospiraceae bacterium]